MTELDSLEEQYIETKKSGDFYSTEINKIYNNFKLKLTECVISLLKGSTIELGENFSQLILAPDSSSKILALKSKIEKCSEISIIKGISFSLYSFVSGYQKNISIIIYESCDIQSLVEFCKKNEIKLKAENFLKHKKQKMLTEIKKLEAMNRTIKALESIEQ